MLGVIVGLAGKSVDYTIGKDELRHMVLAISPFMSYMKDLKRTMVHKII